MRTLLALSLTLFLGACGGADKPTPTNPAPDPAGETPTDEPTPTMMTPDQCEAAGGTVVGDIGDGSVQCAAGMVEIGNVSGGVEASLCCQAAPDDAE